MITVLLCLTWIERKKSLKKGESTKKVEFNVEEREQI